jgi:aerobic-type carbon monoxide dehydrogenase small subunit (CoxS/CutS family)
MSNVGKPAPKDSGFSRRAFLKGSGAAAAATALANGPGVAEAAEASRVVGPGGSTITLVVNGTSQKVAVEPRTTLLEALRYGLNVTGPKPISVDGSSGGSTVLIDGKPASANSVLAIECDGKKITTAESLGGDTLDPVAEAFVHHDASQCGFCTPGFVIAVKAFLAKHPKATEKEIRAGLNGNLCRCGTYGNIIPAVQDVVKGAGNG